MIAIFREQAGCRNSSRLALKTVNDDRLSAFRALLASIHLGLGRVQQARAQFESLAGTVRDIPHDMRFWCALSRSRMCAALACATSKRIAALAKPYENLNAVFGPLGSFGSVASYLGLLRYRSALARSRALLRKGLSYQFAIDARTLRVTNQGRLRVDAIATGTAHRSRSRKGSCYRSREAAEAIGMTN